MLKSFQNHIETYLILPCRWMMKINRFHWCLEELISMYWQVGEYLHKETQKSTFGDSYIDSIAKEIQEEFPGIKGFNRRGLYRMKQFYETYAENDVVTPVVSQISWTNHLLIMSGCKSDEEREFYIRLCIKEKYSKLPCDCLICL